jgi:hypothetical protein
MSLLTLNRIRSVLETQFGPHIDMSDYEGKPDDEIKKALLSRALGALYIKQAAGIDIPTAGQTVTDGYGDNGLDAIYFDPKTDTLHLVQGKWSDSGNKPIDSEGTNCIRSRGSRFTFRKVRAFNDRVRSKEAQIRTALYADRPIRMRLVTIHSAGQSTAAHVRRSVDDLVDEINNPVGVASSEHIDQAGVYSLITAESTPIKIKLQIGLNQWGAIDRPFMAYYGRVHIGEIAQWWKDHRNFLFVQNLRVFYYSSDVNDALKKTLASEPDNFWYFNNGITVICDSVTKGLAGSLDNTVCIFTCEGVSVVNGAQTVGSIGDVIGGIPEGGGAPPQGWVQVRIISLEKCPPDFARQLTRAANLQNAVGNREFAAMDPLQYRLATDFSLDRRKYVYKSGEPEPRGDEGCSIVEATQALGCALSVALAVQVKREIGALWASTDQPPYTDIFPQTLTTERVWRSVLIMRAIDEELQKLRSSDLPRADLIAVHMNRIILHLVYLQPEVRNLNHDGAPNSDIIAAARTVIPSVFKKVVNYMERMHQTEYPAPLSKNLSKCEKLVANYDNDSPVAEQSSLDLVMPQAVQNGS